MWGHIKGVQDNNVGPKTFIDQMKHFWQGDGWETYNTPKSIWWVENQINHGCLIDYKQINGPRRSFCTLLQKVYIKWMQNQ
jgi:hypothetical protein